MRAIHAHSERERGRDQQQSKTREGNQVEDRKRRRGRGRTNRKKKDMVENTVPKALSNALTRTHAKADTPPTHTTRAN